MLELIFLDRDCEAGCNTLLIYYPKYPLMCEICAVAICDSGYSEERTIPPKKFEKKVDEALKCVAGVKEEDCKIILVNTAETSNPL